MGQRELHDALAAFVEEAAWELAAATAAGEEVPFEVVDAAPPSGRGRPLYCYRPMTGAFVRGHAHLLTGLDSHRRAAAALTASPDGLEEYLEARAVRPVPGELRDRAGAALLALLDHAFADAAEFEATPQRVNRACAELERFLLTRGQAATTVLAPVLNLAIASPVLALAPGLTLLRGDLAAEVPAEACWATAADRPNVLAVIEGEPAEALPRLRVLQSALRLFEHGGVALGPVAWSRAGSGPWRLELAAGTLSTGRAHGPLVVVPPQQEDELRAFCSLVARRLPAEGGILRALARYELGCERAADAPAEALADHLAALRTLLEPEGPASGRLAGRLAALCAEPSERAAMAERVAQATADGTPALAEELETHLRALLRDVICGHLRSDLRLLADELLGTVDPDEQPTGSFLPVR